MDKVKETNKKICEVCGANPYKYTCPRCEVKTCCLVCTTIHKKELSCNGQRDCTAFVPISKFNNLNLLSDYRFLEDVDRMVTNSQREYFSAKAHQSLPRKSWNLKNAASRRKHNLLFLPQHFTRHKLNQSRVDLRTDTIYWKLDLVFPQGDMVQSHEIISEDTKLASVLEKYLNPVKCPEPYKHKLRFYHAAGMSDIVVLLKSERCKTSNAVYEMDLSLDIKENLYDKTIIENPLMYVVRKAFKDEYVFLEETGVEPLVPGKKTGFFGDFTPIGFFDSIHQEEIQTKNLTNSQAFNDIKECAHQLKYEFPSNIF